LGTYTIPQAALAFLPASASGQLSLQALAAANSLLGTSLTPGSVAGGQVDFGGLAPDLATIQVVTIQ
jgi:hypothetical protein